MGSPVLRRTWIYAEPANQGRRRCPRCAGQPNIVDRFTSGLIEMGWTSAGESFEGHEYRRTRWAAGRGPAGRRIRVVGALPGSPLVAVVIAFGVGVGARDPVLGGG